MHYKNGIVNHRHSDVFVSYFQAFKQYGNAIQTQFPGALEKQNKVMSEAIYQCTSMINAKHIATEWSEMTSLFTVRQY